MSQVKNREKSAESMKTGAKQPGKPWYKSFRLTIKGKIALVLIAAAVCIAFFIYLNRPTPIDKLALTYLDDLNPSSVGITLQESFADTYEVKDITIYGETLNLLHSDYSDQHNDDLYGKNVMLRNVETGEQLTYNFSGGADSGIPLGSLQPGVYEIYIYDQFTPKRVYTENEYHSDPFTTMRRNKEVSTINLDASKDYLKKLGNETDENYLYLTVTSSLPKVKIYDVVLDPSGLVKYQYSSESDPGYTSESFNEANESYTFAMQIQSYLEEAGLRVLISREDNQPAGYYGVNSRVGTGYASQAKVFLSLEMSGGDEPYPYLMASPLTEGLLANQIAYDLKANGIQLSNVNGPSRLDQGVLFDTLSVNDQFEYTAFSMFPALRETGGKATFTGRQTGSESNENFRESYGMYGVIYFYASAEDPSSQSYFRENKELMARSIAQGIIDYFQITDGSLPDESGTAGE